MLEPPCTAAEDGLRLTLYGGVSAWRGAAEIDLGGVKPRVVLAVLALASPGPVDLTRLIDSLWGEDLPTDPVRDLRTYVSRLRAVLGSDVILTERRGGYRCALPQLAHDAGHLEAVLADASMVLRNGRERPDRDQSRSVDAALESLQAALADTVGMPLAGVVQTTALTGLARSLEELRTAAEDRFVELLRKAGRDEDTVRLLEQLVASTPLHEDRWAELISVLAQLGRRAEALRCFQRARQVLGEVGMHPGERLQAVEADVLGCESSESLTGSSNIVDAPQISLLGRTALPETRFVEVAGASVAYQIWGSGPIDVVLAPNLVSHLEAMLDLPGYREWIEQLAAFSRLVLFDKRGNGMSDGLPGPLALDDRIQDIGAVMDAAGMRKASLIGMSEGSALSLLFAARNPERVTCVVAGGGTAAGRLAAGMVTEKEHANMIARLRETWGTHRDWWIYELAAPSLQQEPAATRQLYERFSRMSSTPTAAARLWDLYGRMDIRDALSAVSCPVLVHYRSEESTIWAAETLLSGLRYAELSTVPGRDHAQWVGDVPAYVAPIRAFLEHHAKGAPLAVRRRLATVVVATLTPALDHARHGTGGHLAKLQPLAEGPLLLATFDLPAEAADCAADILRSDANATAVVHTGELHSSADGVVGGPVVDTAVRALHDLNGHVVISDITFQLGIGRQRCAKHRLQLAQSGLWIRRLLRPPGIAQAFGGEGPACA